MSDLLREILGDELEELLEDARENARESAREEGYMERQTELIRDLLRFKQSFEFIAQIAKCSVAEVQAIVEADELKNTGGE